MRKIFTTLFTLAALTVQAQYLPNGSFDNWKSACGSTDAVSGNNQRPGVEPMDWNGSSVNQMGQNKTLVFNEGGAVKLQNQWVGMFGIGSVAPGYITLGTPWVYASMTLSDCDGGTYGGVQFTHKPDAIKGRFRRDDSTGENSYIVVYMWNGTFVSNIGKKSGPDKARDNVDRAILGMTTTASNGTLVAKCQHTFSSTGGGWQEIVVPIEYLNNQNPQMMNVVISGGDYFNRGNLKENTTLFVDDVQFVYYSDLSTLRYNGVDYLKNGQTNYTVNEEYSESKLDIAARGKGATVEKNYNSSTNVLTITVKGNDYAANSNSKTVYTVTFSENGGVVEPEPEPTPDGTVDYTPAFTGTKTMGSRWIKSVALVSETYADDAANVFILNNNELLCYNDYTGVIEMKAAAGETVTLSINDDDETSWMNVYAYIDADKNGFTASIADGSSWQPAGDLVTYSFYNNNGGSDEDGWNSAGAAITGNDRSTVVMPAFTVPAEAGVYRMRVKLDWCNIDPNGDRDGKFGDFMDNGGQIVDFMLNVVGDSTVDPEPEPEPEPEPTPGEDVDYTPTYTGTRNYSERDIAAVKFVGTENEDVYELSGSERVSEYLDLTEVKTVNATPGETLSLEIETEGSWVNHYVYIDFDADGFTASIETGSNWQVAEDLVAYSFYNNGGYSDESGWNSEGEIVSGDNRSKPALPSFVVPAQPGIYRLRIKQDWCSIDPAGDSDSNFGGIFSNYGGQIIDVMLNVTDPTGIESVETESGALVIYDLQGRRLNEITTSGIYVVNGKKVLVK